MMRLLCQRVPGPVFSVFISPPEGLRLFAALFAEHTLKATSLAKLSHFIGEETKFQRLRGGSGVVEAPQQYLKLSLATLL